MTADDYIEQLMAQLENVERQFPKAVKEAYMQGLADAGILDEDTSEEMWNKSQCKEVLEQCVK